MPHIMRSLSQHGLSVLQALIDAFFPRKQTLNIPALQTLVSLKKQNGHESLLPYRNESVKQLLAGIKHRKDNDCLSFVATIIAEHIQKRHRLHTKTHCVSAIPATALRKRHAQDDHLARLIDALSRRDPTLMTDNNLLTWNRDVARQNTLSRHDRLRNVSDALSPTRPILTTTTYLIIDDVTTTGATLTEARQALRRAGASSVLTLAIAH